MTANRLQASEASREIELKQKLSNESILIYIIIVTTVMTLSECF